MKSFNEAITTRDPLGELKYSYDKIEQTGKPGANRIIYPANDWYDMLFKDYATSYRANVSARGGGKVATYYVAGAFTQDTGILSVDKRNSFNNNIDQKTYTLRSNVDINVTSSTKLAVRLTGNFTDYQGPLQGGSDVYKSVVHSDPVLFPAYYPMDDEHIGIQHIMFGNYEDGSYINPYANLVRGYRDYQRSQMIAAIELNQNLNFITKGLSFMTLFNLTRLSEYSVNRSFHPFWYTLDRYDSYTGEYHIRRINDDGTDYLTYGEGDKIIKNSMYSESRLNYNREFGNHAVTGLLVLVASESLTANAGERNNILHSRILSVPDDWLVCNGLILPDNYVDVGRFESIYGTCNRFRVYLSSTKSREEAMLARMAEYRGVMLEDIEARKVCGELSRQLFNTRDTRKLDATQRIMLAQQLRRQFKLTFRQLSTLVRLPETEIRTFVR